MYRSLSPYDVGNLVADRGILSKHSPPHRLMGFDPWIATTRDLRIANGRFKGEKGIVVIDLNRVPSIKKSAQYEFMGVYEPYGAEYAAEMAENDSEVSVYKYIPISAIVGWIP